MSEREESEFLELAERASQGDRQALEELLERMLPDLRAFVRLKAGPSVRRHESSSDIVQSICREILTHAERFEYPSESAFKRWLFTTALRKLSDRRDHWNRDLRDAGRTQSADASERSLLAAYAQMATPSEHASVREELGRFEEAMERLSEPDRAVIVMTKIVGVSSLDLANEMDSTPDAVRHRLHRALAKLSRLMREID